MITKNSVAKIQNFVKNHESQSIKSNPGIRLGILGIYLSLNNNVNYLFYASKA